ncbi:hypothetical protein [Nitratifractor sp.]
MKTKRLFFVTLLYFGILIMSGCGGGGNAEGPRRDNKEVAWFLSQHEDLKENYFVGKFGVDSNPPGWDTGAYMRAYIDMYEATRDVRILRKLNELLKIVADGNDAVTGRIDERTGTVLPGWGTRAYDYGPDGGERYSDMLTNALFAYPLAAFVRIVREDPALAHEFGADAQRYEEMVRELYRVQKPFVTSKDSPYPDGTTGACYAYPENYYEDKQNYSGYEAPINLTVIIAEPLAELYRASVAEGRPNDAYQTTVEQVADYIWWNMRFKTTAQKDRYLIWYYWPDNIDPDTIRMEDLTHGARLAEFVVTLHDADLRKRWTQKRMQYLANTFTCGALIGDTTFANYIDGTGGVYENDAATLYEWLVLQRYSHASSRKSILYYLKKAMREEGESRKYNLAVFAKFVRYGKE